MEFERYYLRVRKKDLTGKPRDSTKTNLMIRFNDKGVFIMKIHKKRTYSITSIIIVGM